MDILIKNVNLLTMTEEEIKKNMYIYISEGRIKRISHIDLGISVEKTIDGENKLAMPGLINAHTHLGMSILRNYADDLPLHRWLEERIWPIEGKFTKEDVYYASILSMAEMIKSGTTTFSDMYFFMDEVAKATEETGMRGILARGVTEEKSLKANTEKIKSMEKLYNRWDGKGEGRIKVFVGAHAPYTCGEDFLQECIKLAKRLDTRIHIHLSETEKELKDSLNEKGLSPIAYAEKIGLFEVPVLAAHCVHLIEGDLEILENSNVYPVNNPSSNLKLASGFAPISKMLKRKIPVSLGTDGASSNNNLNMFEEVKLAALINKALDNDAISVTAYEALKMATINGAKALGIDGDVGTIEEGKIGDIILIDLNVPHLYPNNNLISALAYSIQGSDVDTTIVNGKVLMENRKLKTINWKKLKYEIDKIDRRLLK